MSDDHNAADKAHAAKMMEHQHEQTIERAIDDVKTAIQHLKEDDRKRVLDEALGALASVPKMPATKTISAALPCVPLSSKKAVIMRNRTSTLACVAPASMSDTPRLTPCFNRRQFDLLVWSFDEQDFDVPLMPDDVTG